MRYLKTLSYVLFCMIIIQSCSTSSETDKTDTSDEKSTTPTDSTALIDSSSYVLKTTFIEMIGTSVYGHQKTSVIDIAGSSLPKIKFDGYDANKTYSLELTGEYLNESYTLNFLSDITRDSISADTVYTTLSLDTNSIELKTDYYAVTLNEGSEVSSIVATYNSDSEKPLRLLDTKSADFYVTLQFETTSWQVKDTLTVDDFRMRPTPSLYNTAGKLYIYDTNINLVDSIQSNGASGSNGRWYSIKFRTSGLTISNGQYYARFERRSDGIVSPFSKITLIK